MLTIASPCGVLWARWIGTGLLFVPLRWLRCHWSHLKVEDVEFWVNFFLKDEWEGGSQTSGGTEEQAQN